MSKKNIHPVSVDNTILTDTKKPSPALQADAIAFKLQADTLSSINNLDAAELNIYSKALPVIESCCSFLADYEKKEFNREIYAAFELRLWQILKTLEAIRLECPENSKLPDKLKTIFRGKIYQYLNQSYIMSRAFTKPFGYPGDYLMMQYLYDNRVISNTNLGMFLDQFFLNDPLAKAVINRVKKMSERLLEFISSSEKKELNILNIASGPGFDLLPIAAQIHDKKVNIHCFDQEVFSLQYVKTRLDEINKNTNFIFYKEDIRNFFKAQSNALKFDLIYNIGLADYLPDRILKALMQESVNALNTDGIFVLAHKDYTMFPYWHPSWLHNWNFIHRSLSQYHEFIKNNLTGYSVYNIFFESHEKIIYFGEFYK